MKSIDNRNALEVKTESSIVREYFDMFKSVNRFSIEMVVNSGFFIFVLMTN